MIFLQEKLQAETEMWLLAAAVCVFINTSSVNFRFCIPCENAVWMLHAEGILLSSLKTANSKLNIGNK